MQGPSSCGGVSGRLRAIRADALQRGRRVFQLVELGGVPVRSFVVRGEFDNVADVLGAARKWGVASCVVREWSCLPGGVRVHVDSVEWLLEWIRVRGLRDRREAEKRGAHSTGGGGLPPSPVGGKRSVPLFGVQNQGKAGLP